MFRLQRMSQSAELKRCFSRTVKYRNVHPDRLCRSAPSKQTGTDGLGKVRRLLKRCLLVCLVLPPIRTRVSVFTFVGREESEQQICARRRSRSAPLGSRSTLKPCTWATLQPRCVGNFSFKLVFSSFIPNVFIFSLRPSLFCRRSVWLPGRTWKNEGKRGQG